METSDIQLEPWLTEIAPTLQQDWSDYLFNRSGAGRIPTLGDWLYLLRTAASTPEKIPDSLARLLKIEGSSPQDQDDWPILIDLFGVTFAVVQRTADGAAMGALLQVQQRVLKVAAELAQVRKTTPTTSILTRRALYLQTITDLGKKLADIQNVNDLLHDVVTLTRENFGYDYVNLFLFNPAKQTLTLYSTAWGEKRPTAPDHVSHKTNEGIIGLTARIGQTVLVNDVSTENRFQPLPSLPQVQAQLATPMLTSNNLLGVLDIQSDQPDIFTNDDRQIVEALADRVAIALENIQLQLQVKRRAQTQKLLQESNLTLDIESDIESVLTEMTRKLTEIMETGACVVSQVDARGNFITPTAEYVVRHPGNPPRTWRTVGQTQRLTKDSLAQQVLKATRPVIQWADETEVAAWQIPSGYSSHQRQWGMVLALPLRTRRSTIGLLELYDKNKNRRFSADDIQICQILAQQISSAIERTRLLDDTYQRLSTITLLHTLVEELPDSYDAEQILDSVVSLMREVIGCDSCAIYLREPYSDSLTLQAAAGTTEDWYDQLRLDDDLIGQAAADLRAIHLPDTRQSSDFRTAKREVRSFMAMPLTYNRNLLGLLIVEDHQPNVFNQTHEGILAVIAGQVSLSLENARLATELLYEQQQNRIIGQQTADGLLHLNRHGDIVTCNPMLTKLLQLPQSQIVGQNIHQSGLPPTLAQIVAPIPDGATYRTVQLEQPMRVYATNLIDPSGQSAGQIRLIQADAADVEPLPNLTQQIGQPLSVVHASVNNLLDDETMPFNAQQALLRRILLQVEMMQHTVRHLDQTASDGDSRLEEVSVRPIINQVLLQLQNLARQREIHLTAKLPAALPTVLGDIKQVEQVLTALLDEALKRSRFSSTVLLTTTTSKDELLLEVQIPNVSVTARFDTITKQENDPLKQLSQEYGGRVWLEDLARQGQRFYLALPIFDMTRRT